MARVSWAKAYVDLRHHPDLFGRPDGDFRLWVCLLLHAKEHCPDGVVRGLTPTDMRSMFGIKAPVKAVVAALDHFAKVGWLASAEGGLHIVKFVDRQRAAGDTPSSHAARQRGYRERHQKQTSSDVTYNAKVTSPSIPVVTSPDKQEVTSLSRSSDGSRSDAEADADSEAEAEEAKEDQGQNLAAGAAPPASLPLISPDLLDGWPAPLLAQVKDALASVRRSGQIAIGPWRGFLLSAKGFSPGIRVRAAETYLERALASEGKGEKYLLGIMRGENKTAQSSLPIRAIAPARGPGAAPPAKPIATAADFEADERAYWARKEQGK